MMRCDPREVTRFHVCPLRFKQATSSEGHRPLLRAQNSRRLLSLKGHQQSQGSLKGQRRGLQPSHQSYQRNSLWFLVLLL